MTTTPNELMVFADELLAGDEILDLEAGSFLVERHRLNGFGALVILGQQGGSPASLTRGPAVPVLIRRAP